MISIFNKASILLLVLQLFTGTNSEYRSAYASQNKCEQCSSSERYCASSDVDACIPLSTHCRDQFKFDSGSFSTCQCLSEYTCNHCLDNSRCAWDSVNDECVSKSHNLYRGSIKAWRSECDDESRLAGWAIAVIVISILLTIGIPIAICCCCGFCAAGAMNRSSPGTVVVTQPQPQPQQVYVQPMQTQQVYVNQQPNYANQQPNYANQQPNYAHTQQHAYI